jgi:hypothetical protein
LSQGLLGKIASRKKGSLGWRGCKLPNRFHLALTDPRVIASFQIVIDDLETGTALAGAQ